MRQARAFVGEPRLVVADEPTPMLDASLRAEILDRMMGMRERLRTALVFIVHDLAVADQVSDRVAVMRDGRVVESGLTGQVIAEPQHSYTKMLIAASECEILEEEPTCRMEGLPLRRRGRPGGARGGGAPVR